MLQTLRRNGVSTLKYLGTTEVHTYAFSVAANAILSFFPAAVLLLTMSRRVFHSPSMVSAIKRMLAAYLPSNQGFIVATVDAMSATHKIQLFSIVMLFISCTGVFEPLEVALNSVWGFKSRNYLMNQIVSLGLALCCGVLALLSVAGTAGVWAPAAEAQVWLGNHIGTGVVYSLVDQINMTIQFIALKDIWNDCQRADLLPDLLAAAEWKSAVQSGAAGGNHYGRGVGDCEGDLCGLPAIAGLSRGIRTLLCLRNPDFLGFFLGSAAAGRSTSFRTGPAHGAEAVALTPQKPMSRRRKDVTSKAIVWKARYWLLVHGCASSGRIIRSDNRHPDGVPVWLIVSPIIGPGAGGTAWGWLPGVPMYQSIHSVTVLYQS